MCLSHHDSFPSLLPSCFHSHGQGQVCCVYRTNVFNSHRGTYRIGLGQFHGFRQYGCRDVIKTPLYVPFEKIIFTCKVPFILWLFLCILYSTNMIQYTVTALLSDFIVSRIRNLFFFTLNININF